jgi:transketolase
MGSAVAECLALSYPARMAFIGVDDKFGQSGKPDELIDYYGMGTDSIIEAARKVCQKK